MKCYHLILIGISTLIIPFIVNLLCSIPAYPFCADLTNNPWIGFFGSYLGGTATAIISMYILYQSIEHEKRLKIVEDKKDFINNLCNDLGVFCTSINYDKIAFLLNCNIKDNDWNKLYEDLSKMELDIKKTYNKFYLKYGHCHNANKDLLAKRYSTYTVEISNLVEILGNMCNSTAPIDKATISFEISTTLKRMESYGDIQSELLALAEKWKTDEYIVLEKNKNLFNNNL